MDSYLTSSAYREFSELSFHIGTRWIVAFVVAEGIILVVDDFPVDVVVTRHAQLSIMLSLQWKSIENLIFEKKKKEKLSRTSSTGSAGSC